MRDIEARMLELLGFVNTAVDVVLDTCECEPMSAEVHQRLAEQIPLAQDSLRRLQAALPDTRQGGEA